MIFDFFVFFFGVWHYIPDQEGRVQAINEEDYRQKLAHKEGLCVGRRRGFFFFFFFFFSYYL